MRSQKETESADRLSKWGIEHTGAEWLDINETAGNLASKLNVSTVGQQIPFQIGIVATLAYIEKKGLPSRMRLHVPGFQDGDGI